MISDDPSAGGWLGRALRPALIAMAGGTDGLVAARDRAMAARQYGRGGAHSAPHSAPKHPLDKPFYT